MTLVLTSGFLMAGPRLGRALLGPLSRGPFHIAARCGKQHCCFMTVNHTSHSFKVCVIPLLYRSSLPRAQP